MSSAALPGPRSSRSSSTKPSSTAPLSRYNYFWPILIFLVGALILSASHIVGLEGELDDLTQTSDKLDPALKTASYHKARFYAMARELVHLAPTDPAAARIVEAIGLRRLQKTEPYLMSMDHPSEFPNPAPVTFETTLSPTLPTSASPPSSPGIPK